MIAWRIFLAGVFLTPFMRLLPIPEFGFSVGDAVLLLGGLGVLADRVIHRVPRTRGPLWATAFVVPGFVVIVSVLFSAVLSQTASVSDVVALVTQYGVALVFLPIVLAQASDAQMVTAVKAFVYGLCASVAIGLAITTLAPAVATSLVARDYMVELATGRRGLFSGVGELSKMAAMCLPLIYFLAMRGYTTMRRTAVLLCALVAALIVTRSGLGSLAALAAVGAVAGMHFIFRSRLRGLLPGGLTGKAFLAVAAGLAGTAAVIRELDRRGDDYGSEFAGRITTPLTEGGLEEVGSGRVRQVLVAEAWDVISAHPIAGIGPGLYNAESAYHQPVHVVPLLMWAETGIVAILGWILLVCIVTITILRNAQIVPISAVAAVGVFAAFITTNLSVPYLYPRGLFLPLLLAFFLLADRTTSSAGQSSGGRRHDPRTGTRPGAEAPGEPGSQKVATTGGRSTGDY